MEKKKIWVVGHKHPDTDSICAAIAYANLKNSLGKKNTEHKITKEYVAKRAGNEVSRFDYGCGNTDERYSYEKDGRRQQPHFHEKSMGDDEDSGCCYLTGCEG